MQPEEALAESVLVCKDERFIQTAWHGIAVLKHERTGYYKASKACEDNHKDFYDWLRNKNTNEYLEACSEIYQLPIEISNSGTREIPGTLLYKLEALLK